LMRLLKGRPKSAMKKVAQCDQVTELNEMGQAVVKVSVCCRQLGSLQYWYGERAIESGGIEVILVAVTNHVDSAKLCERACCALHNIANNDKEKIWLVISLGVELLWPKSERSGWITTMFKLRCKHWPA
jgi:hypothetical protein